MGMQKEDTMEKAIKKLSILMVALTVTFFITTFVGGNADLFLLSGALYKIFIVVANLLIFLVPIVFMVIFVLGMTVMLRTIMTKQTRIVGSKKTEKLPMAYFLISIICFIIYFIFVSAIFSAGA